MTDGRLLAADSSPPAPSRGGRFAQSWLGGFNLLPYRQRNARLARRRRQLEWIAAAFAGYAAVLLLAGWQTFERARLDAQRASIEQSLTQLSVPLEEHATLLRTRDEQSNDAARVKRLSGPLTYLRDLLEALSFEPGDGVVLQQLRQREHETELLATSRGHVASAQWLKRLSRIRGVKGAEVGDLHRPAPRGSGAPGSMAGLVEFGARLRWDDEGLEMAGKRGSLESRPMKSELSGGAK